MALSCLHRSSINPPMGGGFKHVEVHIPCLADSTTEGWWWEAAASGTRVCMEALRRAAYAGLTCCFTVCGAVIGSISGAVKGQTTETGLLRGAAIGAVAGAVVSLDVLESCLQGQLLSKVALFGSLLNGKVFREWVSPAMLKAYQWQISMIEEGHTETSDIFATDRSKGLLPDIIKRLPAFNIISNRRKMADSFAETTCVVCLQDLNDGESARRLPVCGHFFHMLCIDGWLVRNASCPVCRQHVKDLY